MLTFLPVSLLCELQSLENSAQQEVVQGPYTSGLISQR